IPVSEIQSDGVSCVTEHGHAPGSPRAQRLSAINIHSADIRFGGGSDHGLDRSLPALVPVEQRGLRSVAEVATSGRRIHNRCPVLLTASHTVEDEALASSVPHAE